MKVRVTPDSEDLRVGSSVLTAHLASFRLIQIWAEVNGYQVLHLGGPECWGLECWGPECWGLLRWFNALLVHWIKAVRTADVVQEEVSRLELVLSQGVSLNAARERW